MPTTYECTLVASLGETCGRFLMSRSRNKALAVSLADVQAARGRIAKELIRTPLVLSDAASERAGRPVYLKLENLQRTGAFKVRGALSKVTSFAPACGTAGGRLRPWLRGWALRAARAALPMFCHGVSRRSGGTPTPRPRRWPRHPKGPRRRQRHRGRRPGATAAGPPP